jgi:hypothetical protein
MAPIPKTKLNVSTSIKIKSRININSINKKIDLDALAVLPVGNRMVKFIDHLPFLLLFGR